MQNIPKIPMTKVTVKKPLFINISLKVIIGQDRWLHSIWVMVTHFLTPTVAITTISAMIRTGAGITIPMFIIQDGGYIARGIGTRTGMAPIPITTTVITITGTAGVVIMATIMGSVIINTETERSVGFEAEMAAEDMLQETEVQERGRVV